MRRYRILVKGSPQELTWLNRLAQKGWLFTAVHGGWYEFKAVTATYRIFTEYVPVDVATETTPQSVFQLLTTVTLNQPAVQVVYSASQHDPLKQADLTLLNDEDTQLKATLGLRSKLLSLADGWTIGSVILITILLAIFRGNGPAWLFKAIVGVWFVVCAWLVIQILRVHRPAKRLRARLQDYDGAWRPTMHVFLTNMSAPLDLDQVGSLGNWRLVGQSKKGAYWYDVQTNASQAEIKQVVQPVVGADVKVDVMSFLGLWPL